MMLTPILRRWLRLLLILPLAGGLVLGSALPSHARFTYEKAQDAVSDCASAAKDLEDYSEHFFDLMGAMQKVLREQRDEVEKRAEKKKTKSKKKPGIAPQKRNAKRIKKEMKEMKKLYKAFQKKCGKVTSKINQPIFLK